MPVRRRAIVAVAGAACAAGVVGLLSAAGNGDGVTARGTAAPGITSTVAHFTSFEDNTRAWSTPGAQQLRIESRSAPHGERVLQVLHRTSTAGVRITRGAVGVRTRPGEVYRASARLRMANPRSAGARVALMITEVSADGVVGRRWSSNALVLDGRFRAVAVRTAPVAGGGRLVVQLAQRRPRAGTGFHADSLSVTRRVRTAVTTQRLHEDAPAEVQPYDPLVAFNRPIAPDAPLDPRSAAIVSDLQENVARRVVDAPTEGEVPPVYVASVRDPFYRVWVDGREERVRVPRDARAGSGSDHPLIVLNPVHPDHGPDVELRVWRASVDHDARRIRGSGTGLFHYNNDGERLNPDASRSESRPFAGQGTGSGLSYLAGLVRPQQITDGRIRHAIRVAWGCNDFSAGVRAPAVRTDQGPGRCEGSPTPAGARVDMGMRLRLDPSVNCDARRAPILPGQAASTRETRFLQVICRGLQEYGLIILDGTVDDGLLLYLENGATADWGRVAGRRLHGGYGWVLRDRSGRSDGLRRSSVHGIPWSRMQVVR